MLKRIGVVLLILIILLAMLVFARLNPGLIRIDLALATFAFELHYRASALIGTPTSCLPMVDRLAEIGADELACFIDFGVHPDTVLEGLSHLVELKRLVDDDALRLRRVLTEYLDERLPGHPPLVIET